MDKKDNEFFKNLLLDKRQEILEELGYIRDATENGLEEKFGEDTTYSTHMADHGTDEQEREKTFYHAARENKFLIYIEEALERINNGTYGICVSCHKEIPKARLEAVPHTQKCVPCKMAEKQE